MNALRAMGIAMVVAVATGCAGLNKSGPPDATVATVSGAGAPPQATSDYRIGVDDRVQVTVWRNPELSVTVPVRPDGKITVPIIGDVEAGGHTPKEVAETIKEKLSQYIRDPSVVVILTELRSNEYLSRVRITGAVRAPKSITQRQGMTVLDAVLEAGGINEFASPNNTKLYRKVKDKTEVIDIDLGDILSKGRLATNYLLRPGDVITVPERLF
jgi:polysaccharide export outer membrane protein